MGESSKKILENSRIDKTEYHEWSETTERTYLQEEDLLAGPQINGETTGVQITEKKTVNPRLYILL